MGRLSWRLKVGPPRANAYANPSGDSRLKNFRKVESDELGDVIVFPTHDFGASGHVGINLGGGIYISARTGDVPGTMGPNTVQPFSGVQIKEVPTDEEHVNIRHN